MPGILSTRRDGRRGSAEKRACWATQVRLLNRNESVCRREQWCSSLLSASIPVSEAPGYKLYDRSISVR